MINSPDIAYELFEKRSSIYSDRPEFPMITDLYVCHLLIHLVDPDRRRMGYDWATPFMHYGEPWRRHRKLMHQKLQPIPVVEYRPVQLKHTRCKSYPDFREDIFISKNRLLLRRLYESPDHFVEHLRHTSGAIIMEACYWHLYSNATC